MYKFEEILFGNKAELLKTANMVGMNTSTIPNMAVPSMMVPQVGNPNISIGKQTSNIQRTGANIAKLAPTSRNPRVNLGGNMNNTGRATGNVGGTGTVTGTQNTFPQRVSPAQQQRNAIRIQQQNEQNLDRPVTGWAGQRNEDGTFTYNQTDSNDPRVTRWVGANGERARLNEALRSGRITQEEWDARMRGLNEAEERIRTQNGANYLDRMYANAGSQGQYGLTLMDPSQYSGPYQDVFAAKQQQWRTQQEQQPQQSNEQYLSNINAGNNLELQNARHNGQYAAGWNNWYANADNIMHQQAQQREQQRQWQAQRDMQDAQKAIDKYNVGDNMKGMTPQDWMAMNPLQRGEYINNYNRDQYKQRSEEILNNADVQAAERQRFADNMNRVHGKAWDARGFTQEQRDAFIDKEFQHSLDKRKQVVGPKMTEGVTQTAQAAPAQPVAPPTSNPNIEPLPQIEQGITPEQVATEEPVVKNEIVDGNQVAVADLSEDSTAVDNSPDYDQLPQVTHEGGMPTSLYADGEDKQASANIMSILFPQRARDIVKEYF